jgi:hypothetical protein
VSALYCASMSVCLCECMCLYIYMCARPCVFQLGHSIGMNHASLDADNNGVIDAGNSGEYGDYSDPMGNDGNYKRFNTMHRLQLGWFHASNVVTDPTPGTPMSIFSSSLVNSGPFGTALIKLNVPWENDGFYISLRTLLGPYDSSLPSGWGNLVYVHRWATPGNTKLLARLAAGSTFLASSQGFRVTVNAIDTTGHTSSVTISRCAFTAPVLTLTTLPSALVLPLQDCTAPVAVSLSYTLQNLNPVAAECPPMSYTAYTSALPTGWTAGTFAYPSTIAVSQSLTTGM